MSRCTLHPHFLNSFDPFLTVDLFSNFIWDNNVKKELKHSFIFSFYRYYVAWKLCTSECLALKILCSYFLLFTRLVLDVMLLLFVKRRRLRKLIFWSVSRGIQSKCWKIRPRITLFTFYTVNSIRINSLNFKMYFKIFSSATDLLLIIFVICFIYT